MLDFLAKVYSFNNFVMLWLMTLSIGATLHVFERLLPADRQPGRSPLGNARIVIVYAVLSPLAAASAPLLTDTIVAGLARLFHTPWLSISSPFLLVVLLLLLYDIFYYWFHRLQHSSPWLWEQHKLHHSDRTFDVTTSLRLNWLETLLQFIFIVVPTGIVIAIPEDSKIAILIYSVVIIIWGQFIHLNIAVSWGALTPIIGGPQYHRIHHSIEEHHKDRNFASILPIWDILFGTYHRPDRNEYPRTGNAEEPASPSTREILIGPMISWWKMLHHMMKP